MSTEEVHIKTGDVLLQRPGGWTYLVGKAIELFAGEYSHARLAYDNWVAVDVRWPGGGRYQNIQKIGPADVYRCRWDLDHDQLISMRQFMRDATTRRYDLPQFLWYVPQTLLSFIDWFRGPNRLDSRNKYICSELVDRAYLDVGIDLVPSMDEGDATPYALSQSELLQYQGTINDD